MIASNPHKSEKYKGQDSSQSPTGLDDGVFSLCSGGVPYQGGFRRIPGKTLRNIGLSTGGVISIYQMDTKIVVQSFVGLVILDLKELAPSQDDFVVTNEGNLVYTNEGLPVLA